MRVRDGLWIASADIANWLGDQPSRLSALERAVKAVPSSVIARYLLARQYRITGHPDKAASTGELFLLAVLCMSAKCPENKGIKTQ